MFELDTFIHTLLVFNSNFPDHVATTTIIIIITITTVIINITSLDSIGRYESEGEAGRRGKV